MPSWAEPFGASCDSGSCADTFSGTPPAAGIHDVTFRAQDGATPPLADEETVRITVVDQGGDWSVGPTPSAVNLTLEGAWHWTHWGYRSSSEVNRKSSQASAIPMTVIGGGVLRIAGASGGWPVYTWSDGTPVASASTPAGVYICGIGKGFEVTVPADSELAVYVGGWNSRGRLWASSSGAEETVGDLASAYRVRGVHPDAAGLTVRYTQVEGTGCVTLQAATLSGGPAANQAPVLAPIGARTCTVGQLCSFPVSATDDGPAPLTLGATGMPSWAEPFGQQKKMTLIDISNYRI
jgi:hypothetical protein